MPSVNDLERPDHLKFLDREWLVQRTGRWLLAALVAAAAAGLFGSGMASRAAVTAADLDARYERFVRTTAESELVVTLPPQQPGVSSVWLGAPFLDAVELRGVQPEPREMRVLEDRTEFAFDAEGAIRVVFRVAPRRSGVLPGRIGRPGGDGVAFRQFAYY